MKKKEEEWDKEGKKIRRNGGIKERNGKGKRKLTGGFADEKGRGGTGNGREGGTGKMKWRDKREAKKERGKRVGEISRGVKSVRSRR